MPIVMKDIDELKAKVKAKLKTYKAKGMDDQTAQDLVKEYLSENEFVNKEGHCLKLSLETMDADDAPGDVAQMDGKALSAAVTAAVKEGLKGFATNTSGHAVTAQPATIDVREDYEKLWDYKRAGKRLSNWGFDNVAEFAMSVFHHDNPDVSSRKTDPRLALVKKAKMAMLNDQSPKRFFANSKATPTTYASELVGADGGFAVPPEYREDIWIAVQQRESILSMTDLTPTNSNVVNLAADENTPWDTSNGIIVSTRAQGSTMTQTKPVLQNRQVNLNEVYALVPATDELLSDAPRLNNYLTEKAPQKIGFKVDELIFRGKGNGEPLGIYNGPGTVNCTSSSTAKTFAVSDLTNMLGQFLMSSSMTIQGDWFATQRAWAYALNLTLGSTTGFPVAMSGQNLANPVMPSIIGMPWRPSQHAAAFSSVGDVLLANMKGYASFVKTDGIDFQTSIHLFFDSGATAFRWRFRFGGEPYLRAPVTPNQDTGAKMSHFVTLGSR